MQNNMGNYSGSGHREGRLDKSFRKPKNHGHGTKKTPRSIGARAATAVAPTPFNGNFASLQPWTPPQLIPRAA